MAIKRLLSAFLIIVLMFNIAAPTYALGLSEVPVSDVGKAMNTVANSLTALNDTASSGEAKPLADIFTSFMDVATTAGKVLTLVNGSVTFLRLIGIMNDPTQTKLNGIMTQLQTIDERLSGMDDKLNDLTTAMSEIKASVEFNSRTEKAILYEGSWRDFEYRYMENGMNKLISQYNSMLRTGLKDWCNGNRNTDGVDNTAITVLYKKNDDGYKLTFTDYNGIPSDITAEDRWINIPTEYLPESFSYDVNTFNEKLAENIAIRISDAIDNGRTDDFDACNYPDMVSMKDEEIMALAIDTVNTLVYRVASAKVNGNSDFAGEVSRQFSNYCSHLQSSGDGLDATLKTMYLTHAFEADVADDIRDFCNRMIIVTGTYGMFASNVLGMSHLSTDSEKVAAVSQMTSAINMAEQAMKNGITGHGNYCYITGTNLVYTTVIFSASAELKAHYTMSNTTYKSYKASGPTAEYGNYLPTSYPPMGDTAMIVLMNTLQSNGIKADHDYFNKNIGNGSVENLGKIVTGYSSLQTLSFDGKTKLHVKNAFGDYFKNNSTITSLPGGADLEDVLYRKKISGSLYDLSSGTLTSNTSLCAIAVYGENHALWITDEGGFMGGPADGVDFWDTYSVTKTGSDSTGVFRQHVYKMSSTYNTIMSVPQVNLGNANEIGYNPLVSFEEDVPPYGYNEADYKDTDTIVNNDTEDTESTTDKETDTESSNENSNENSNESRESSLPTGVNSPVIALVVAITSSLLLAVCINYRRKNYYR